MENIKTVMLCGLGAIGTIYAQKLNVICDFKLIADKERRIKYEKNPRIFNGVPCKFNYAEQGDKADLIIIATKNYGFLEAVDSIKPFVKDSTLILSLLNGIESEEILKKVFGAKKVLDSYFVGHTSTRHDRNITFDGIGKIVFGEKENTTLSERVMRIKELFDKADINYEIPQDMDYSRWYKFMINVGTNQASAVLLAPYKVFQHSKQAMDFAKNLMKEAEILAKLEGVKNTEKMLPEAVSTIMSMLPETKTSMLQDIEAGRKTEVDIFAGTILKLAKKHSVDTPYNKVVYDIIKAKETV